MQLRVPAAQAGSIPPQQIASNQPRGWSIQVGAFPSRAMTDQALRTAQSRLPSTLQGGQPVIVPQNTQAGMIFRARLQGYDQGQANSACAHLGSCLVVAPGS
jgi:D-alanyl-D-alanine carboxypeptidase